MVTIKLPNTKSNIIRRNNRKIFCVIYKNKKGLFRKDVHETKIFGRKICDEVSELMGNDGFFSSDELPNYGISQKEVDYIFSLLSPKENDLIVFFAYPEDEARKTNEAFNEIMNKYLSCNNFRN